MKNKRVNAVSSECITMRIRFENSQQYEIVKAAAEKRGLGFNLFVRLAAVWVAEKVSERPFEELLGLNGVYRSPETRQRAKEKAIKAVTARWSKRKANPTSTPANAG